MEQTFERKQISVETIDESLVEIGRKTAFRLEAKGYGTFASTHEILGIIAEEYDELKDAIRKNDTEEIKQELLDIAVSCHFAIACINEKTLDW
jgi:NTP pyrophosphatase (non-canonical NTP hydrolase)